MKKFLTGLLLVATMVVSLSVGSGHVLAASPSDAARQQACAGVNSQTGGTCGTAGAADLKRIIRVIVNILSIVAGVAGVIMIILAGMKYVTSGGDSQAVSGAKRTLIYAIVGLMVVAFSQVIVHYVLRSAQ